MKEAQAAAPRPVSDLAAFARDIRGRVLELSHRAGTPHLASQLSCADILAALYGRILRVDHKRPDDPGRDRLIFSKGHATPALYVALAARGFFPEDWLDDYAKPGARLTEQGAPGCAPGVEAATGSLGHGLPLGLGMALAARIQGRDYRVFVVMSDGECNEGSVWEAAMAAPAKKADNLAVVVDANGWQATDRSGEVMALEPLVDKWRAFGWNAAAVDGHDVGALAKALEKVPDGSGRPVAVVARTVKGKGVSFMEDDNNWHYRIPTAEEVAAGRKELGLG